MFSKLSFNQYMRGLVRFGMIVAVCCLLLMSQFITVAYAQSSDPNQILSVYGSLYKQLQSGHKIMETRSFQIPEKPTVYLTFDDGPSKITPEVLDLLKKENIQATFFVCGDQLNSKLREEMLKRMVDEGHTIGNHSYNHDYKQLYSNGFSGFWEQIQQNEARIEQITGIRPKLIRAPGGTGMNFDAFYFYYLDQAGYLVYDWDVDSEDSRRKGVPASEIIAAVKKSPLKHEITVLIHDGAGHEQSVKALPEIIRYYQKLGYSFAPLAENVKPAQFNVSVKQKWSHSTSLDFFNKQVSQSLAYAAKEQDQINSSALVAELDSDKSNPSDKVSLRAIAEGMGASVTWNPQEQSVLIRLGQTSIRFTDTNRKAEIFYLGQRVGMYELRDIEQINNRYYISMDCMKELFAYAVDNTNQQYFPGKDDQLSSRIIRSFYK
ncbi:hypothetical protein E0485_09320 [Paenibacillus albiflavus]|uniref:NodB homology domain-containing protein n=1 Tax=Paenibacillus albiflavus TaxID=2545760 RepID=A0A4R4EHM9_9BACL|nr:polysaccharide deacetylase [Paenibacillus albiflavus]TCZ77675.1 hypothetical protein E0485_09320 [Paenibacillus albiflavus]